jgi:hypothetical protein
MESAVLQARAHTDAVVAAGGAGTPIAYFLGDPGIQEGTA